MLDRLVKLGKDAGLRPLPPGQDAGNQGFVHHRTCPNSPVPQGCRRSRHLRAIRARMPTSHPPTMVTSAPGQLPVDRQASEVGSAGPDCSQAACSDRIHAV
jgi:hypothetical protein